MLYANAFLLSGSHLLTGRLDPKTITPSWTLNRRKSDLSTVLEEAVRTESIEQALNRLRPYQQEYDAPREVTAAIDRPLSVHLLYWTAWTETDGTVHFRTDVYQA